MSSLADVRNSLYQTDKLQVIAGALPEVEIPVLTYDDDNIEHRAAFMAYHYSIFVFVMERGSAVPSKEDLAGSLLGLVFNTLHCGQHLNNNKELLTYCKSAGFIPIIRILSGEEDDKRIAEDHRTQTFLGRFGAKMRFFTLHRDQQLVMLGLILLTIGTNLLVEEYPVSVLVEYPRSFTLHMDAFMEALGLKSGENIWTSNVYPSIRCLNCLETFLSSSFLLRRELFRICSVAASGQDRLSNLFKAVIDLIKETSMTLQIN
jgi:hypothetical protein